MPDGDDGHDAVDGAAAGVRQSRPLAALVER